MRRFRHIHVQILPPTFLDTDELKMALWTQKVFEAFEK